MFNYFPDFTKSCWILKLKSYWLKWNLEAASAVTEGFLKAAYWHMDGLLKATANSIKNQQKLFTLEARSRGQLRLLENLSWLH